MLCQNKNSKNHPFLSRGVLWSIGIYTGASPETLAPAPGVKNPVLTAKHVTDRKAVFVADPFMLQDGGKWHMFFEVLDAKTQKGEIGLAESSDGLRWEYRQIVLSEAFHLSYPYVFKESGKYYMIPESESEKAVYLYEAEPFPLRWKRVRALLTGRGFHDASIFHFAEKWWMFTGIGPFRHDTLCLYYADQLLGPWQPHALNPLIENNPYCARPGGRILVEGDRVLRIAQEDYPDYGKRVRAFEVTELSAAVYREREIPQALLEGVPHRPAWNSFGMHHVDAHRLGPRSWLACVDGQKKVPVLRFGNWELWIS